MMKVEVETPEEYMGDVIGDLNKRRGQVNSMDDRNGVKSLLLIAHSLKCLATQQIFAQWLKVVRLTQWNLITTRKFLKNVSEEIIKKRNG